MEISSIEVIFEIGPFQFTNTIIWTWILMAAIVVGLALMARKVSLVPSSKAQVVSELLVDTLNNLTRSTMGDNKMFFAPYMLALIVFLAISNLSGFLFFGIVRPPTADWATTLGLALLTFFMTQGFGIKSKGVGSWVKGFFEPVPFLVPLNIIGEIANPVSLSFRLFGNILGGLIIMTLFYSIYVGSIPVIAWTCIGGLLLAIIVGINKFPKLKQMSKGKRTFVKLIGIIVLLPIFATSGAHFYFDLFSGLLQSFIFTMLSMVFISSAMD